MERKQIEELKIGDSLYVMDQEKNIDRYIIEGKTEDQIYLRWSQNDEWMNIHLTWNMEIIERLKNRLFQTYEDAFKAKNNNFTVEKQKQMFRGLYHRLIGN